MLRDTDSALPRRDFLTLAATTGLAASLPAGSAIAAQAEGVGAAPSGTDVGSAEAAIRVPLQLESDEIDPSPAVPGHSYDRVGSDFMVDVIRQLGIEYVAANCGSSFRGLQESITVYGNNQAPEFLTCLHEEASVAMAHGYAKVAGKPMAVLLHNTVGLQHASMAIYNAFCDGAPVVAFAGNSLDATKRRGGAEWYHSDTDAASLVRSFTKWDDQPVSLRHFAESTVRAVKIATTPPMGPVVISIDKELQESASSKASEPAKPRMQRVSFPSAESSAIEEVAALLVAAEAPVLIADRLVRTPQGVAEFVRLAELLQAPVICPDGARMSFPQLHPLCQSMGARGLIAEADVILGLEMGDFWSSINSIRDRPGFETRRVARNDAKLISIGVSDLFMKAGPQTIQRFQDLDLSIAADGETTLPLLAAAVERLMPRDRGAYEDRGRRLAEAKQRSMARFWTDAGYAWDASPISTARLSSEIWEAIKNKDWSLVHTPRGFTSFWDKRLPHHDLGRSGGSGVGYAAPASAGAALANSKQGRLSVSIQPDGDLMYSPGVLWTAAHHSIPILYVMHNNRAYHQEVMHLQRMACEHNRGIDRCTIGTTIDNPFIDFAGLARSLGVYSQGPITDPADLGPALRRAIDVVERGEPALLDVVCQPR